MILGERPKVGRLASVLAHALAIFSLSLSQEVENIYLIHTSASVGPFELIIPLPTIL